jgi:hypothetical protein
MEQSVTSKVFRNCFLAMRPAWFFRRNFKLPRLNIALAFRTGMYYQYHNEHLFRIFMATVGTARFRTFATFMQPTELLSTTPIAVSWFSAESYTNHRCQNMEVSGFRPDLR